MVYQASPPASTTEASPSKSCTAFAFSEGVCYFKDCPSNTVATAARDFVVYQEMKKNNILPLNYPVADPFSVPPSNGAASTTSPAAASIPTLDAMVYTNLDVEEPNLMSAYLL